MTSERQVGEINAQSAQPQQCTFPLAPIRKYPNGEEDMVRTVLLIIITLIRKSLIPPVLMT